MKRNSLKNKLLSTWLALLGILMLGHNLSALPVSVTYTVSGSSGDYYLDFSVQNNMPGPNQDIYLFGVQLNGSVFAGSPSDWFAGLVPTQDNSGNGGSSTVYNRNWIELTGANRVHAGNAMSGFIVHITDTIVPSSVSWYVYFACGLNWYNGNDFFGSSAGNPAFEGTATESNGSVPDGGLSLVLLGGAFALMGAMGRRFRK